MKITFTNIDEVFAKLNQMLSGHSYQIITSQQGQPTQTQKFQGPNTKLQLAQESCDNPTWKQIDSYLNGHWQGGWSIREDDTDIGRKNPDIIFQTNKAIITVKHEGFPDLISVITVS